MSDDPYYTYRVSESIHEALTERALKLGIEVEKLATYVLTAVTANVVQVVHREITLSGNGKVIIEPPGSEPTP